MPEDATAEEPVELADRVRLALQTGDLEAVAQLLHPQVRWGAPGGPHDADCRDRGEVIAWWAAARAAGARARVTEVTMGPGAILVGLEVTGTSAAGGAVRRWRVLTVRGGRITDIRGFGDRAAAAELGVLG